MYENGISLPADIGNLILTSDLGNFTLFWALQEVPSSVLSVDWWHGFFHCYRLTNSIRGKVGDETSKMFNMYKWSEAFLTIYHMRGLD